MILQDVLDIEKRLEDRNYGLTAFDGAAKEEAMRKDLRFLVDFVRSIGWPGKPGQPGS